MYFIMKISNMCLKKNLNFKMCRNWRKLKMSNGLGICRGDNIRGAQQITAYVENLRGLQCLAEAMLG